MDYIALKKIVADSLAPFGFKKEKSNFWVRKGSEVLLKIHLQRSAYGASYYIRGYYIIKNLSLHYPDWGMIGHTNADFNLCDLKGQQLAQMCDLENNIPDFERKIMLESLIREACNNSHLIETEDELKEMILKRLHPEYKVVMEYLGIDQVQYDQMWRKKRDARRMQRLAQVFESSPTGDYEIRNEEKGFCVTYNPDDQEILVRLYMFINPYRQNVEKLYKQKLDKLKYFTKVIPYENPMQEVERIDADKLSKLGYMQVELTIFDYVVDSEGIEKVKDAIFQIHAEQLPYESPVWFKAEHDGHVCYYEREWWSIKRAVIMGNQGFERYDFSDELKFDTGMWDIVTGNYDQLEKEESFELISSAAFQDIWDKTEKGHEPEPWE